MTDLQAAIDQGGIVNLPAGEFVIERTLYLPSNIRLCGAGKGLTTLRLADGADAHMLQMSGVRNIRLSSLSLDGNRTAQTLQVHCLRGDGVDGLIVDPDVEIRNAAHYGIGLQRGVIRNIRIECEIHSCGGDCIDIKNKESRNFNINILHVQCSGWGLNPVVHRQAAIDIRGPAQVFGPTCYHPPSDGTSVRFRPGSDVHGYGGHNSLLVGGYLKGEGADTVGVDVHADDCRVMSAFIRNFSVGCHVLGKRARLHGLTMERNTTPVLDQGRGTCVDGR